MITNSISTIIILILLVVVSITLGCRSIQNPTSKLSTDSFSIVINQVRVEPEQLYILTQDKVEVFKVFYKLKKKKEILCFQLIYSKKLSTYESEQIYTISKQLCSLEDHYEAPTLGGILWTVQVRDQGINKEIILEDIHTLETKNLFNFVNTLLPASGLLKLLVK